MILASVKVLCWCLIARDLVSNSTTSADGRWGDPWADVWHFIFPLSVATKYRTGRTGAAANCIAEGIPPAEPKGHGREFVKRVSEFSWGKAFAQIAWIVPLDLLASSVGQSQPNPHTGFQQHEARASLASCGTWKILLKQNLSREACTQAPKPISSDMESALLDLLHRESQRKNIKQAVRNYSTLLNVEQSLEQTDAIASVGNPADAVALSYVDYKTIMSRGWDHASHWLNLYAS